LFHGDRAHTTPALYDARAVFCAGSPRPWRRLTGTLATGREGRPDLGQQRIIAGQRSTEQKQKKLDKVLSDQAKIAKNQLRISGEPDEALRRPESDHRRKQPGAASRRVAPHRATPRRCP
jgi:hypothetical protein